LTLLVGRQEGHPACKELEWWDTGKVICLERGADLRMAQLMPLPLTVSCVSKIQIGFAFLAPAHPGSPGKRAVKWVCVCNSNIASESQHLTMQYVTRIVVNQHSQSNKNRPNFSECNMHGQMITAYLYIQYLEYTIFVSFSALRLLVGHQEEHLACKN